MALQNMIANTNYKIVNYFVETKQKLSVFSKHNILIFGCKTVKQLQINKTFNLIYQKKLKYSESFFVYYELYL